VKASTLASFTGPESRLAAALRELETVAGEISEESLPDLFAGIERVRWMSQRRISAAPPAPSRPAALLTADQVATRLGGVSRAQVYRLAKTALRSAVVDVGEGTLRFDADRLARFIESRRRG